ncbi:hypothetical protein ACQEVZ_07280 [Dactylosporangium sp. CA-152071]|uniref:hypothetical protein n=1 Tax=Dactylosporangium sp. CA-152071 TaxID=3239933 RepID=UPI003D8EBE4B
MRSQALRRRWPVLTVAAALTAAAVINWSQLGAQEPSAQPPTAANPAQQQPGAIAAEVPTVTRFAEAKHTGKPVEILERHTETTE